MTSAEFKWPRRRIDFAKVWRVGCSFRRAEVYSLIFLLALPQLFAQCEDKQGWRKRLCEAAQIGHNPSSVAQLSLDALLGPAIADLLDPNRQAITSSFASVRHGATLPETFSPDSFSPLGVLGRTPDHALLLRVGAYEGYVQSYCLHAGTYGPRKGDGYLPAPLEGPRAEVVRVALRQSVLHPEISQQNIQLLLWAILAHTEYEQMPLQMQHAATTLLPPRLLVQLQGGPLSRVPASLRQPLERKLQNHITTLKAPVQRIFKAESDIRLQVTNSATYQA
jgi:hypothetical protein